MEQPSLKVHDSVHGVFGLPSYIRAVVETVEFSRLKHLKQLGVVYLTSEGACHTRFDHSLGILLDALNLHLDQPIGVEDRMCVMLAAVLHDIGHGPFSHMWEKFVAAYGAHWRHEETSVQLARLVLRRMEYITEKQIDLVCAIIEGSSELLTPDRLFLAHIVSSDVDVDRCDYLQRDSHHVQNIIRPSRHFTELFHRARITTVCGKSVLVYHWEDFPLVFEMAAARQQAHRCCYQNPEVLGLELMVLDVLHEAERAGFRFSRNGKSEPLCNVHTQPDLFKYLDDSIIEELATSNQPGLERTKEIITRLKNGEYYKEIIRSPIDLKHEVEAFNVRRGKSIVVQALRHIQSAEQWFCGFNVMFYKLNAAGKITMFSTDKAEHLSNIAVEKSVDEIKDYIVYCTSTDSLVQQNAKYHFTNLLNSTSNLS